MAAEVSPQHPEPDLPTTASTSRPGVGPSVEPDQDQECPSIPLTPGRRRLVLFAICWNSLPSVYVTSSTLAAAPEIAEEFATTTGAITTINAGVFAGLALCPLIWLPMAKLVGRRTAILLADAVLCVCLVISALAPNIACFAAFWVLAGTIVPFFLVAGQTIIADVYQPTVRGTATGIFLGTCNSSSTISPLMGALIANFTSWRVIYGVCAGIAIIGLILCFFFVPERSQDRMSGEQKADDMDAMAILRVFDPSPVFKQFKNPRVLFSDLACGMLVTNMMGLLSSVRRVINPRFGLTSPLVSGLFYLAPGTGFCVGSLLGGRLSDWVVKRYIRKRGRRIPQDRLRSSLPAVLVILPAGTLLYGWSVEKELGGMALPAASAFVEGISLMASFSSVNTYSAEVVHEHKSAVISSKYMIQYAFSAASTGSMVAVIDSVGVGWAFTIISATAVIGGIFLAGIALSGPKVDGPTEKEGIDDESDTGITDHATA